MKYTKHVWGILAAFFFFTVLSAQPADQSARYRIKVWGMNIGEFRVSQKSEDGDTRIEAVTDVEVKMIFTYRVKYVQKSIYRNGSLWNSHVQTIKDDKINSDFWLKKTGDGYLLIDKGDSSYIRENITYSGSLLYFNEPRQVSSIFKERSGERQAIRNIAKNTYAILDEKGKKTNEYEYRDGVLYRASLVHSLAVIHLERI